jgi:hypothetical protein
VIDAQTKGLDHVLIVDEVGQAGAAADMDRFTTVPLMIEQIQLVRCTAPLHYVITFRKRLN